MFFTWHCSNCWQSQAAAFELYSGNTTSSFVVYKTSHPEYKYVEYLSSAGCFSNRRLLSRSKCRRHVLHVDTGWWVDIKGRTGYVRYATHLRAWRTSTISLIAQLKVMSELSMISFFGRPLCFRLIHTFWANLAQPNACGGFPRLSESVKFFMYEVYCNHLTYCLD